jgi:hypothetical protein
MERNETQVGKWTLTVSMATLYRADKALKARNGQTVGKLLGSAIGAFSEIGGVDQTQAIEALAESLDFEDLADILTAFLYPTHKMKLDDAIDDALNDGSPADWLSAVFNLMLANHPQAGDRDETDEEDSDEGEPEGNAKAA